jgi:putative sterol carrier protein
MAASDPQFVITVADGRVSVAPLETGVDAPLVFTAKSADAEAVASGELNLNVGFMQGRIKAAGDMRALMDLLARAYS